LTGLNYLSREQPSRLDVTGSDTGERSLWSANAPNDAGGAPPYVSLAEAEAALQRAEFPQVAAFAGARLAREPRDLRALLLFGDASVEMERFAEAADAFRRALELDANNVRALNGLAAAALGSRDPKTAFACAKRAHALAPAAAASYLALGPAAICVQDASTIDACFAFLGKANAATSAYLQTFWAQSLAYLDKFDYAAGIYEPLARAAPNKFDRLFTLAYYLLRAHRLDEAKASIDALAALAPDAAQPYDLLAEWALQVGDLQMSTTAARRAIDRDKTRASAYLTLAKNEPAEISDAEVAILNSLLHEPRLSAPSRFAAGLALGLALEHRRDYDAAFAAFSTANGVERAASISAGAGYDPGRTEAQVALTKRLFPAESFAGSSPGPDRGGGLIFIVGMPRSGTTLMDQILASHSRVESVGENPGMTRLFDAFLEEARESNDDAETILARRADEWRALYRLALGGADERADFVVNKALMNFWSVGLIVRLLPDAKIILMQRDPMDVCLSIFRLNFLRFYSFSNDLLETAHYYRCFEDICAHWRAALPEKIKTVEYETLLEDFEAQVAAVLRHCGLEMEPGCLAFHENKRPVFTLSAAQVRKGVNQSARGRWRRYEKHLGPLKAALGMREA
jgi:tetratricopeptide (TPR) repeat protein